MLYTFVNYAIAPLCRLIVCAIPFLCECAHGDITLGDIKRSLSTEVDMKLNDSNVFEAAQVIQLAIVQSWQQSEGLSGVSVADMRRFKFYSSSEFEDIRLSLSKPVTKLQVCKEIVRLGDCQVIFDPDGMHLVKKSIKLAEESYHILSHGVFFLKKTNDPKSDSGKASPSGDGEFPNNRRSAPRQPPEGPSRACMGSVVSE